jgi:hypothetical protein
MWVSDTMLAYNSSMVSIRQVIYTNTHTHAHAHTTVRSFGHSFSIFGPNVRIEHQFADFSQPLGKT